MLDSCLMRGNYQYVYDDIELAGTYQRVDLSPHFADPPVDTAE